MKRIMTNDDWFNYFNNKGEFLYNEANHIHHIKFTHIENSQDEETSNLHLVLDKHLAKILNKVTSDYLDENDYSIKLLSIIGEFEELRKPVCEINIDHSSILKVFKALNLFRKNVRNYLKNTFKWRITITNNYSSEAGTYATVSFSITGLRKS